jgi:hypothetical protein
MPVEQKRSHCNHRAHGCDIKGELMAHFIELRAAS